MTITVSTTNTQSQRGASHPPCAVARPADAGWSGDEWGLGGDRPALNGCGTSGSQTQQDVFIGLVRVRDGSEQQRRGIDGPGPKTTKGCQVGRGFSYARLRGGRIDQGRPGLGRHRLGRVIRLRHRLSPLARALSLPRRRNRLPQRAPRQRDARRGVRSSGASASSAGRSRSVLREDRVPTGPAASAQDLVPEHLLGQARAGKWDPTR